VKHLVADGATIVPPANSNLGQLVVKFPAGDGYQRKTVTLRW
jgi:hypothetical protein